MSQLLTDLMQYALLHQPKKSSPQATLAQASCEQALINLNAVISEAQAELNCDMPAEAKVCLENSLLVQLLQNLIGNAIHSRREAVPPVVTVGAQKVADAWQFHVSDNGEGIEPQYFEGIFQPFRRLHGVELAGSGIGLATCKRTVEQAGGMIWVGAEPGKGSTFRFTLPNAAIDDSD